MKKVLCLLLAILIVGSMFTACGNSNQETESNQETAKGSVSAATDGNATEKDAPTVEFKVCEPDLVRNLSLNGNDVIYDENEIKITLTNVDWGGTRAYIYCDVVNNSDKIIQLGGNYVKVNNQSASLSDSDIVLAGESQEVSMKFVPDHFVEESTEYLELAFSIMECASEGYYDYTCALVEDGVAIYQKEGYDPAQYPAVTCNELVYDDAYVSVYLDRAGSNTDSYAMFGYTVVNKTNFPILFKISECEYTLNRQAYESIASCPGASNYLAPNSYLNGAFNVENWTDDVEKEDLTSGIFTLQGYLIECSDVIKEDKLYEGEDEWQKLPFDGKTFTVTFPENENG